MSKHHPAYQGFVQGTPLVLLESIYHHSLLEQCKRWIEQDQYNVAIVFAQTACEIFFEQRLTAVCGKKGLACLSGVIDEITADNHNIGNERVRKIYTKLTGDNIGKEPFWQEFKKHATTRNGIVHGTRRQATKEEAEKSLEVVWKVINHVEAVVQGL